MSSSGDNPDLESFRRQWLSDLQSKGVQPGESSSLASSSRTEAAPRSQPSHKPSQHPPSHQSHHEPTSHRPPLEEDEDFIPEHTFDDLPPATGRTVNDDGPRESEEKELVSALDHFEEAMEKEAQGNMGDSLHHYRRAYRLDQGVDKKYREKYFPKGKVTTKSTGSAATTTTTTSGEKGSEVAQAVAEGTDTPVQLSFTNLITSFSALKIDGKEPDIEGDPAPPCPISELPGELITQILRDLAVTDFAGYVRMAQVCKHLAYLVFTERRIWKRICLGSEVGFTAMHHGYKKPIEWQQKDIEGLSLEVEEEKKKTSAKFLSIREREEEDTQRKMEESEALVPGRYTTWQSMFRSRPRIRFNGCYISTVNYLRAGVASTNQATWGGAPIHVVTYYRYLRFFRDGSCISLLTTDEPSSVVHHLTRENLLYHRSSPTQHSHLPSAVMHLALKGRWKLGATLQSSHELEGEEDEEEEGGEENLDIETEGAAEKYTYHMALKMGNARRAKNSTRNNKFVWRGFWSYNKLTDDWGEFTLKHDKPFFFSRVRSYGVGE